MVGPSCMAGEAGKAAAVEGVGVEEELVVEEEEGIK